MHKGARIAQVRAVPLRCVRISSNMSQPRLRASSATCRTPGSSTVVMGSAISSCTVAFAVSPALSAFAPVMEPSACLVLVPSFTTENRWLLFFEKCAQLVAYRTKHPGLVVRQTGTQSCVPLPVFRFQSHVFLKSLLRRKHANDPGVIFILLPAEVSTLAQAPEQLGQRCRANTHSFRQIRGTDTIVLQHQMQEPMRSTRKTLFVRRPPAHHPKQPGNMLHQIIRFFRHPKLPLNIFRYRNILC